MIRSLCMGIMFHIMSTWSKTTVFNYDLCVLNIIRKTMFRVLFFCYINIFRYFYRPCLISYFFFIAHPRVFIITLDGLVVLCFCIIFFRKPLVQKISRVLYKCIYFLWISVVIVLKIGLIILCMKCINGHYMMNIS